VNRHVLADGGVTTKVQDLTADTIASYVLDGGTYEEHRGMGDSTGRFAIRSVPDGEHLTRIGDRFIASNARSLDLSVDVLGRTSAAAPTGETRLEFNVNNLAPWQPGDSLQWISPSAGAVARRLEQTPGATAITGGSSHLGLEVDYALAVGTPRLVNKGEEVFLIQSVTRNGGSVFAYRSISRVMTSTNLSQQSGFPTTVNGTFNELTSASTWNLDWRRSSFEAHRTAVHPRAVTGEQVATAWVLPKGPLGERCEGGIELVHFAPASTTGDALIALAYASPFPFTWTSFGNVRHNFNVTFSLSGMPAATVTASLERCEPLSVIGAGAVRPELSPPTDLTIEARAATTTTLLSGVGLTPLISWTAPATGTPTGYRLRLVKLAVEQGATRATDIALFYTSATSLRLPPGVLFVGTRYVIIVEAEIRPQVTVTVAPYRPSLPTHVAPVMSEMFTP
jgi:hypothetical protein